MPIDLDIYECNIVFLNERIGEFQYTIEGQGLMPEAKKIEPPFECLVDQMSSFYLDVDVVNKNLQTALTILKLEKKKENLNQISHANSTRHMLKPIKNNNPVVQQERCNFTVETNKSFFIIPSSLSGDITSYYQPRNNSEETELTKGN